MMLHVFAYAIAVAAVLSVVGICAERFARLHRFPRRTAWAAAMLLSVLLPAAMILLARPADIRNVPVSAVDQDVQYINPVPEDFAESPAAQLPAQALPSVQSVPAAPSTSVVPRSTWKLPRPSDRLLITMWMATSSVLALYLLGANLLLRRRMKGWHNATVQDQQVLISEVTGPALLGAFSPRIVVPRWLLLQPHGTQALILQHEQQHVLARDALLIMAGLVAIVAVPWNLPLWWQWRRMRQAIELDCDARVLGAGAEANAYAEVLLAITQRSTRIPAGALAMSEPVHALERRIANLLPDAIRYARLQTIAVLLLAAAGAGAALALEAPALPGRAAASPMAAPQGVSTPGSAVTSTSPAAVITAAQSTIVAAAAPPRAVESAPAVQTQALAQPATEPAMALLAASASNTTLSADTAVMGTPRTTDVASLALSPDGLTLAVVGRVNGNKNLWLKPVGGGEARLLPGTSDPVYPFWSPDGTKLAFFSEDQIKQIDIKSGQVTTLAKGVSFPAGGSWGKNGTILYASVGSFVIMQMPEKGGDRTPVLTPDAPDQYSLSQPHFLPDGVNFLYYTQGTPAERGVYQGILGSTLKRRLVDSEAAAVFAGGKLYYVQNRTLHSRSFDPVLGVLGNDDRIVAENVSLGARSAVALASNGNRVAYRTGSVGSGAKQLSWYDRSGNRTGTVGEPFVAGGGALGLSPDGKSVLVNYMRDGFGEIGVIDLATGKLTGVSENPADDIAPLWSSDGASVLFSSKRTSTIEMYRQELGKPPSPDKVFSRANWQQAHDMTRDGRYLFYRTGAPDLWAYDQVSRQEIRILPPGVPRTEFSQVSPDGRWIAFQSDVSGSTQVHLHGPFAPPSLGTTSPPLTVKGGGWVRWRGDGKELFYAEPDGTLMSISLTFSGDGKTFAASAPVRLFSPPMNSHPINNGGQQQYVVSPDGQRFLLVNSSEGESPVYLHTP